MTRNLILLTLCLLVSGCGLFEVYGKREYVVEHFRVIDRKTRKPISDVDVVVMATHGPKIFPTITVRRPGDVKGRTDNKGEVSLKVAKGPKMKNLACGMKGGFYVVHEWEMGWERDVNSGVILLLGDASSRYRVDEPVK